MNAETIDARMLELSQFSYLTCVAGARVVNGSVDDVAAEVPTATASFGEVPEASNKITMTPSQVRDRVPGLRLWLIQSLLIRLDSLLHAVLDDAVGRRPEEESGPIESDIARLSPDAKVQHDWAYRDVVLLAEHRNCIVHGDGSLSPTRENRLRSAGWQSREEALERVNWEQPTFADFIQYKKAVRTIANVCIQSASEPAPNPPLHTDGASRRR